MQPPSRRTFLALGLLLTTTAACTAGNDEDTGVVPATPRPTPDPDEPIRLRAVAATDTLLAGYDALLSSGGQSAQLTPLRAEVAQHRAALAAGLPATAAPSATATTPAAATAPAAAPTVAALAALERQTAQTRLADLAAAKPPLARLLASIAASGVLHSVALGDTTPAETAPATPTPSASAATDAAGAAALQPALSAEHAAVYGYGVVGARLPEDQRADARSAYAAHEARRDAWQRLIAGLGGTPSAASAGYQLPFAVTDAASATRLAAHLETRLTTVYADLVAAVPAAHRATAAEALRECALRARRWGAEVPALPGIPDAPSTAAPTATATATPTG